VIEGHKWEVIVDPDAHEIGDLIPIDWVGVYPWQGEDTLKCIVRQRWPWPVATLRINGKVVGVFEGRNFWRTCPIPHPEDILIFSGTRLPKGLKRCPNLVHVSLVHCTVSDSTLGFIRNAKGLRVLKFEDGVGEEGSKIIGGLKELEVMGFHLGKNGDDKIKHFDDLVNLKEVAFTGELTGIGFKDWESKPCLKKLDIIYCGVSPEGLKYIAAFTNLESLKLGVDGVTDSDLLILNSLQNLRLLELRVGDGSDVTYEGLFKLHRSLTDCVLYYGGSHGRLSFSPDGTIWEYPGRHTAQ
jgi:hypothetical protein